MLAHAACNFEKKPGQVYHLYERNGKHQWSMLSLDDYKGKVRLFCYVQNGSILLLFFRIERLSFFGTLAQINSI